MSEKHILSFGCIPTDHPGGLVSCGTSIKEITLHITETEVVNVELGESKPIIDADFFSLTWSMWRDIAQDWLSAVGNAAQRIEGAQIARCWGVFLYEPLDDVEPIVVAEEEAGEFENHQGQYNGRYYVRYQFEEDNEIFGERVVII